MFEQFNTEIIAAAKKALPYEMCGVIFDGKFVALENAAPDKINNFAFSTADTKRFLLSNPRTQAVVHSHPPYCPPGTPTDPTPKALAQACPSMMDMRQQVALNMPFVIAALDPNTGVWEVFDWGDHTLDLPLYERPFRPGVEDCYTAIRKWWWQKQGVKLPEFPRNDRWWEVPAGAAAPPFNMYVDGFEAAGFSRFQPSSMADLRPGDVGFYKLNATVFNHAMIYAGDGLIYHHAPGRFAREEPLGPWFNRIKMWVRR